MFIWWNSINKQMIDDSDVLADVNCPVAFFFFVGLSVFIIPKQHYKD